MMTVSVHLKEQSEPITRHDIANTYQKGSLFCVLHLNGEVEKFPLADIFRITEVSSPKPPTSELGDLF